MRAAVLALRRGKGMVVAADDPDSRSAGSFFTNPVLGPFDLAAFTERVHGRLGDVDVPGHPDGDGPDQAVGGLADRAGRVRQGPRAGPGRGVRQARARARAPRRRQHRASCSAVAREVRDGVREAFGVDLVPEPVLVGGIAL